MRAVDTKGGSEEELAPFAEDRATTAEASGRSSRGTRATAGAKTILLVDDDVFFLESMARTLACFGFRMLTSASSAEALKVARRRRPDLVLLDMRMERHDEGLYCCRDLIKSGYRGAVVILSADKSLEMTQEAIRAGAHGYLVKPCATQFEVVLRCFLEPCEDDDGRLPLAAEAYLLSRGVLERDIELLREYSVDFGREKCLAARLGQNYEVVRRRFNLVRHDVGASTQVGLGRILGMLSCFARVPRR